MSNTNRSSVQMVLALIAVCLVAVGVFGGYRTAAKELTAQVKSTTENAYIGEAYIPGELPYFPEDWVKFTQADILEQHDGWIKLHFWRKQLTFPTGDGWCAMVTKNVEGMNWVRMKDVFYYESVYDDKREAIKSMHGDGCYTIAASTISTIKYNSTTGTATVQTTQ